MKNLFALLVHEHPDCSLDLVRNLEHFDPASSILLYNGGDNPGLLEQVRFEHPKVLIYPNPERQHWGRLHGFALDCMHFALEHLDFDTITIVDSDQLLVRRGYSGFIARFLAGKPKAGMLVNSTARQEPDTRVGPAQTAWAELELWQPFLAQLSNGVEQFPRWSFWPTTVFTARAVRALIERFDSDALLRQTIANSRICATEEVILPTLVSLLGFELLEHPCSFDFVQYRVAFSQVKLERGFENPSVFWVHPVPREKEDRLRRLIRSKFGYAAPKAFSREQALELPIWLYWQGERPAWIATCQKTALKHGRNVRLIDADEFDQLWNLDRDLDLERLHLAHKADFVRAFLLYRFGGLWLDSDCLVMRDLSEVLGQLEHHEFIGYRERQGNIANSFMASRPGGQIIGAHYRKNCAVLRSKQPLEWLSLGSWSLEPALQNQPWLELNLELIQPICWSQPSAFFEVRDAAGHEAVFNSQAWCYMLSNQMVQGFKLEHPELDLLAESTFFRFLLERSHS
jgi:hypothetical protein